MNQIRISREDTNKLATIYTQIEADFILYPTVQKYGSIEEVWGSYCTAITKLKSQETEFRIGYPAAKELLPGPALFMGQNKIVKEILHELTNASKVDPDNKSVYSTPDPTPLSSPKVKPKSKSPNLEGGDGDGEELLEDMTTIRWADLPRFDPKKHQENDPRSHLFDLRSFMDQHKMKITFKDDEEQCEDIIKLFIASLQGRARDWFEYAFPDSECKDKTSYKAWKNFTSAFEKNYSLVGSTIVEQQQALRSLKWEPAKQSLDDFVTTFIRLMRVMTIDPKTQVGIFSLAMPTTMYPLLAKEQTLNGAIEQAKQGLIIGMGVTPMTPMVTTPQPVQIEPAKPVPFMPVADPYFVEPRAETKNGRFNKCINSNS